MSAIASFYRIPKGELANADGDISETLDGANDLGDVYDWSGYVLLNVLLYLEEIGLGLGEEIETAGELFVATARDLDKLNAVDVSEIDDTDLAEFFGEHLDLDETELREAISDSLSVLKDLTAHTGPDEVLIIEIG